MFGQIVESRPAFCGGARLAATFTLPLCLLHIKIHATAHTTRLHIPPPLSRIFSIPRTSASSLLQVRAPASSPFHHLASSKRSEDEYDLFDFLPPSIAATMKVAASTASSALTTSFKSNSSSSVSPTKGISFMVPSTSKRRRISANEENCDLTRVKLFDTFIDSESSYRDDYTRKKTKNQHATLDSVDDDYEDDNDDDRDDDIIAKKFAHEKNKQQLLERITRANSQSTSMEGEFDEVVMTIPKAKLYENKGGSWLDRGLCSVKFLRDVEEGEYSFGMIRMRLVMTNLNESITLKIDDLQVRFVLFFYAIFFSRNTR